MNEPVWDWLLLIVGGCGAVWALTPPLLTFLGLAGVRFQATDDPALAAAGTDDPEYDARAGELAELGFEPIGLVTESMYFQGFEWWKHFVVRIWANTDRTCFASLYRLHPAEGLRIAFRSLTTDQGIVCAACPGAGVVNEHADYLRREYPFGTPLHELLTLHQRDVETFCERRGVRPVGSSLEEITQVEEAHERRLLKGIWGGLGALMPAGVFAVPAYLLHAALRLPVGLGSVGLALCAGMAVYGLFRLVVASSFAQEVTQSNPPSPVER